MRAVMVPSARASAPKSPPAVSGEPPARVEVPQRRQGQGPPAGAVRQRLLDDAEVTPLPDPAHQRGGHVVEARLLQRRP